jgi:hypothetical protein
MELVLALYFLFAAIYWSLRFIEWVFRTIGIIKPPYQLYSFERDVLKPLGYDYFDYHLKPNITSILRVQKTLSAELLKRIQETDWRCVKHDLDENQRMEEEFIENLKKQL